MGQAVRLIGTGDTAEGRVVASWPAIGMVDVQWPHTANRHPVEDLQILAPGDDPFIAPMHEDVPGGPGSSSEVSEGAEQGNVIEGEDPHVELIHEVDHDDITDAERERDAELKNSTRPIRREAGDLSADRVAREFVKRSLYWGARDRKYRASREEHASGQYHCPTRGCSGTLRRATYKMAGGQHVKLHACPSCLFMIRAADVLVDHCDVPVKEVC